ncbi:unnamed protein product [Symbiodinium sp. KB8]|nr:unnamed protein product [Symbiodinium sp. KB8]
MCKLAVQHMDGLAQSLVLLGHGGTVLGSSAQVSSKLSDCGLKRQRHGAQLILPGPECFLIGLCSALCTLSAAVSLCAGLWHSWWGAGAGGAGFAQPKLQLINVPT